MHNGTANLSKISWTNGTVDLFKYPTKNSMGKQLDGYKRSVRKWQFQKNPSS